MMSGFSYSTRSCVHIVGKDCTPNDGIYTTHYNPHDFSGSGYYAIKVIILLRFLIIFFQSDSFNVGNIEIAGWS